MKKNQDNTGDELEKSQRQAEEYLNGWKRALADYENYKREASQNSKQLKKFQLIEIARDILPLIDTYHQTLLHIPDELKKQPWYQGLVHIEKQWGEFMRRHGIERIEALGEPFNPEFHEAIQTQADASKKDEEITDVATHGYTLDEYIIRPAKVTVNKLKTHE